VLACVLALTEATRLVPAWSAWRAGAPELYADQHARAVASNARGVLLAVALPVPLLLGRATRRGRVMLWVLWGLAMLGWGALWMWRR
jgi:hypothetical protein